MYISSLIHRYIIEKGGPSVNNMKGNCFYYYFSGESHIRLVEVRDIIRADYSMYFIIDTAERK
jgi:hypothetical protein